jgi:hypothetical protein
MQKDNSVPVLLSICAISELEQHWVVHVTCLIDPHIFLFQTMGVCSPPCVASSCHERQSHCVCFSLSGMPWEWTPVAHPAQDGTHVALNIFVHCCINSPCLYVHNSMSKNCVSSDLPQGFLYLPKFLVETLPDNCSMLQQSLHWCVAWKVCMCCIYQTHLSPLKQSYAAPNPSMKKHQQD